MTELAVMTVRIEKSAADGLDRALKRVKLRRDSYLADVLEESSQSLSNRTPNSERAARLLRLRANDPEQTRVKIGLRIPSSVIERINLVCEEHRISRDLFVETVFRFLAFGWKDPTGDPLNSVASPLHKAAALLESPFDELSTANGQVLPIFDCLFASEGFTNLLEFAYSRNKADESRLSPQPVSKHQRRSRQ